MPGLRTVVALGVVAVVVAGGVGAGIRTASTPAHSSGFITDAQGRSLVAHGFNTAGSSKQAPSGLPDFTEDDLAAEYSDMGTDYVRFLISWRMVEPEPGQYDDAYLDTVADRVGWYADRGYHVMLDMHQDLWGNAITADGDIGNGAPAWATHMEGLTAEAHDMWELTYLDPGVIRAFDNFWNTTGRHPELMEHYAKAWQHVAQRFADDDTVVTYDLMNEPYGGTIEGPAFEAGPLTTLYQKTTDAIREVDDDTWICLEPQAVGYNWGLPSGLRAIDDPRAGEARIAFCPHLYPLPIDVGGGYAETADMVDGTLDVWIGNTLRTAHALGDVPVILDEFGLDTTQPGALDYVDLVYRTMAARGIGVVYWSRDDGTWGPYESDGTKRNLIGAVDRAYPRAVDGDLVSWQSADDELAVRLGSPGAGESEAYLPMSFGDDISVEHGQVVSWDAATRVLTFTIDADAIEAKITAG